MINIFIKILFGIYIYCILFKYVYMRIGIAND